MKLGGRLIVNQAGGVMENSGLCLHRNFGFPYVPGSAVKGCARHYAWEQWRAEESPEKKKELAKKIALTFGFPTGNRIPKDKEKIKEGKVPEEYLDNYLEEAFPELFGSYKDGQGRKLDGKYKTLSGAVAFLDARPHGKAPLSVDVLTCHHMDYYSGDSKYLERSGGLALDNEEPNPQPFPVVEAGVTFLFQLCPLKASADLSFAAGMLTSSLEVNGIGAKTSAGYGWFMEDPEVSEQVRAKLAEEEQKKQDALWLASMSPDDRTVEELGRLRREEFIQKINVLDSVAVDEQRLVLRALIEKFPALWNEDKKAKPKMKGGKRAVKVRTVAKQLGMDLP
jgi:CRISPR type III-B/RAMP module RAMP protein Cmr6